MWIDLSANGSLVDEATFITAIAGVGFGIVKIWQQTRSSHSKLDELAETLNHVDTEAVDGEQPTLGQRVVRIERQVDSINENLTQLSTAMTDHILWEQKKADRIDQRLKVVEATLDVVQGQLGAKPAAAPTEITEAKARRRAPRK